MTKKASEKRRARAPTNRMSLQEAWKMSKLPYVELLYKANQLASGTSSATGLGSDEKDSQKRIKSIMKNAKVSKSVFALFICLGTAVPFAEFATNASPISLVSAIAISLMISFAYLVFYSLQILPSFSSAEPYSLLLTLPFREEDFSIVTMFSFVRTFDYLAIGSIFVPFVCVVALTESMAASALMFGASVINVIFAIVVGLWISRLFYKNMTRGGRSKGATLTRMVFLITWGFAVLSTGFLFQIVTSLLPYVNQVFSGSFYEGFGIVLSLLHPFTFGLAIASLALPALFKSSMAGTGSTLFAALSYASTTAYFLIAFLAARRTTRILTSITHGQAATITREIAKEFTLKVRNPLSAYIMKDMRSASKNPSTAFLFALPLFDTLVIYIALNERGAVNIADVTSMTIMGTLFTLMIGTLLLNTEKRGLEYTLSLPLSAKMIVDAKSLIATLTYVPVPFVILLLQLPRSGASISSLIPFIEVLAISAATTAEIAVMVTGRNETKGGVDPRKSGVSLVNRTSSLPLQPSGLNLVSGLNFGRMTKAIGIALTIIAAPIVSYFIVLGLAYGELVSISAMILVAVMELVIVQGVLRVDR